MRERARPLDRHKRRQGQHASTQKQATKQKYAKTSNEASRASKDGRTQPRWGGTGEGEKGKVKHRLPNLQFQGQFLQGHHAAGRRPVDSLDGDGLDGV